MTRRLDSLTGARFIAALVVVLLHALDSAETRIADIPVLGELVSLGALGVAFFFILSGFVLTYSARPGDRVRDFYQRRFARIVPLHIATWIVAALSLVVSGTSITLAGGVLSLLLLQAWVPSPDVYFAVNGVAWSLACEMFFYALHPLLMAYVLVSRKAASRAAIAAVAGMVAAAVWQARTGALFERATDLWVFPPFALGFFVVGMAVAVAIRDGYRVKLSANAALATCVATYAALVVLDGRSEAWFGGELPQTFAGLLFLPAAAFLIAGLASVDLGERPRSWLATSWMVRLGEWSFALYLIHTLILRALVKVLGITPPSGLLGAGAVLATFVGFAVAASGIAYVVLERPFERRLRPRRRVPTPAPPHADVVRPVPVAA